MHSAFLACVAEPAGRSAGGAGLSPQRVARGDPAGHGGRDARSTRPRKQFRGLISGRQTGDATCMPPVRALWTTSTATECTPAPARPDAGGAGLPASHDGREARPTHAGQGCSPHQAAPAVPAFTLRCGWCDGMLENVGVGRVARCRHCHGAVRVPVDVLVACVHCGQSRSVRLSELTSPQQCPACSHPIATVDLVLAPHRRRRPNHRRHHAAADNHADAAWAVLIIGMTLVAAAIALTVL